MQALGDEQKGGPHELAVRRNGTTRTSVAAANTANVVRTPSHSASPPTTPAPTGSAPQLNRRGSVVAAQHVRGDQLLAGDPTRGSAQAPWAADRGRPDAPRRPASLRGRPRTATRGARTRTLRGVSAAGALPPAQSAGNAARPLTPTPSPGSSHPAGRSEKACTRPNARPRRFTPSGPKIFLPCRVCPRRDTAYNCSDRAASHRGRRASRLYGVVIDSGAASVERRMRRTPKVSGTLALFNGRFVCRCGIRDRRIRRRRQPRVRAPAATGRPAGAGVEAWLRADPEPRGSVIHERLVSECRFTGSYQRVKLFVCDARPRTAKQRTRDRHRDHGDVVSVPVPFLRHLSQRWRDRSPASASVNVLLCERHEKQQDEYANGQRPPPGPSWRSGRHRRT